MSHFLAIDIEYSMMFNEDQSFKVISAFYNCFASLQDNK